MTWLSDGVVSHLFDVASWPEMPDERYRILSPIGRGGMGRVFLARDERLHRDVAIKVSNTPAAGSALDARLQLEALVLADLEHPGIAPVHDAGVLADGRLFYVMKLVRGETLEHHAGALATESDRLSVFERIVESVAFAHARGVVHRDLKPSNVMVGAFREVLVLDWGAAKLLKEGSGVPEFRGSAVLGSNPRGSETIAGTRIGTPGFMAPEQAGGHADSVTPATDVYALGAVLAWLWRDGPAPSRRLKAIVTKCRSARPADRYRDAAHLAEDIARYRAGQAVEACPETVVDRGVRWFVAHRSFIFLIAAYLLMRVAIAMLR